MLTTRHNPPLRIFVVSPPCVILNPLKEPQIANMSSATNTNIESFQHEERVFPPPPEFAAKAHIKSMAELEVLRAEASADPEKFWARFAESELHWFKKWDSVLKWEPPHAEWFG